MSTFTYTTFKYQAGKKVNDLSADQLKLALYTSTYAPNQDTDATYAGITGEVAAGNGYATGGVALSGVVWAQDNANHRGKLTATNPSWALTGAITFRYAVLYDATTGNLVSLYDFGSNQTVSTNPFTLNFDATNGALDLT